MKSQTIKKYPAYFICWIIRISFRQTSFIFRQRLAEQAGLRALLQDLVPRGRETLPHDYFKIGVDGVALRYLEFRT